MMAIVDVPDHLERLAAAAVATVSPDHPDLRADLVRRVLTEKTDCPGLQVRKDPLDLQAVAVNLVRLVWKAHQDRRAAKAALANQALLESLANAEFLAFADRRASLEYQANQASAFLASVEAMECPEAQA